MPFRVVAVLLAPARIEAGRLNMSIGRGTDPDELVSGRNADRLDAADDGPIRDAPAILVVIRERSTGALASIAGSSIAHIAQAFLRNSRGDFRRAVLGVLISAALRVRPIGLLDGSIVPSVGLGGACRRRSCGARPAAVETGGASAFELRVTGSTIEPASCSQSRIRFSDKEGDGITGRQVARKLPPQLV